jgi:tRNA(Ile2)-agmatinylcytidine synthase
VVRALLPGDEVEACGSYKGGSLNLEKIHVIGLARDSTKNSPLCPSCGKRMTSAGHLKGYKCRGCGRRETDGEMRVLERKIGRGWYEVPPSARRHLVKPLIRVMRHR